MLIVKSVNLICWRLKTNSSFQIVLLKIIVSNNFPILRQHKSNLTLLLINPNFLLPPFAHNSRLSRSKFRLENIRCWNKDTNKKRLGSALLFIFSSYISGDQFGAYLYLIVKRLRKSRYEGDKIHYTETVLFGIELGGERRSKCRSSFVSAPIYGRNSRAAVDRKNGLCKGIRGFFKGVPWRHLEICQCGKGFGFHCRSFVAFEYS